LDSAFDEALTYAALRKAESVGHPVGLQEWLADRWTLFGVVGSPVSVA